MHCNVIPKVASADREELFQVHICSKKKRELKVPMLEENNQGTACIIKSWVHIFILFLKLSLALQRTFLKTNLSDDFVFKQDCFLSH